jgi:hypothetical protein
MGMNRAGLVSFGKGGESYATRLPLALDLVVFDEIEFGDALAEVLNRAYYRPPVLAAPIVSERRSAVALDAAPRILSEDTTYWERRRSFELLRERSLTCGGKQQRDLESLTKKATDSIRDILLASDCVIVRSWQELSRLCDLLNVRPVRCLRAVAPPAVPVPAFRARRGADTIVIWAPDLNGRQAAIFGFALEELKTPAVIFCSDPEQADGFGLRARFIRYDDDRELARYLDQAAALIDGAPDDPGSAVELARLGIPLAASFVSGAYEYVDGLYQYDPWDFRSILHCALAALGGEPPSVRPEVPRPQDLLRNPPRLDPPAVTDPPLVSVVMSTLNRRGVLPRAIDSIARQTYSNCEVIVANDGGKPIEAIVERVPHARVINHERNMGAAAGENSALRLANGKYVAFLSDDDYLFPSHLSRLVYALERTGAAVAVGMTAESYLQPGYDGAYDFIGTSLMLYRSCDPTLFRAAPFTVASSAMLVRRDVVNEHVINPVYGIYDEYHTQLRLLDRFDFLWVSHLVLNMDSRLDISNRSSVDAVDRIAPLKAIWSEFPANGRPDIDAAREDLVQFYLGSGGTPPPQRGVTRVSRIRKSVYRLDKE